MSIVFACIAPHGGHLLVDKGDTCPVPNSRRAMAELRGRLEDSRPDAIAIITPHGITINGSMSLFVGPRAGGDIDNFKLLANIDIDLARAWADHATELGVPVKQLVAQESNGLLPLDWGVTIPIALLAPPPHTPPLAVACPSRNLSREQLVNWGAALATAAGELDQRVALIVSADQGHGHAPDGPYGFAPESAEFDEEMAAAVKANNMLPLLKWDEDWINAALADSYWQTLSLIGVQRHVPLRAEFLSYEIDHYFGLLCAAFDVED